MVKNWKLCSDIDFCRFNDKCKLPWRKFFLCFSEACEEKGVCTFDEAEDLSTIMFESDRFVDEKTGKLIKERNLKFYNEKTGCKIATKELPCTEGLLEFLTDKRLEGRL